MLFRLNRKRIQGLALMVFLIILISFAGRFHKMIMAGIPGLHDHEKFPSRVLEPEGASVFDFNETGQVLDEINFSAVIDLYNQQEDEIERPINRDYSSFEAFLEDVESVAFIIIRADTIVYENYFDGYSRDSELSSFSLTKSLLSILIGCAIDDGYIGGVDDRVGDYIPELDRNGFSRVTIKHLLQMTSGVNVDEVYYNPFWGPVDLYHSDDLYEATLKMEVKGTPGTAHNYNSGDSQLLGVILDKVLGEKSITAYMQEKLWGPLGMQYSGNWLVDKKEDGLEKTFCCLSARPIDFARFGRLYLEQGNWNGRQIVPASWVRESVRVDTLEGSAAGYQYHWYVADNYFSAYGYAGQILFVYPERDMIIVRMGNDRSRLNWPVLLSALTEVIAGEGQEPYLSVIDY
ncbi:MAG: serine hydrolase domain-containing protein [Bacteroidales bacterium]